MISLNNVSKYFGSFQALKKVSFDIKPGEIVGFVGKNGAGKTTLMRILTSYYRATSGSVLIAGEDASKKSLSIRRKIGYLPETPPLYPSMTVQDYLNFAAEIKDVPARDRRRQVDRVLEECQLESVYHKRISTLSKGYKQRTGIAQAIIHEPDILILDEPTSGLDPIQILQLHKLIKGLKNHRVVIISTHTLSEVEKIAQRVLIIKGGEIIIDQQLNTLLLSHASNRRGIPTLEDVFVKYHQDQFRTALDG